MLLKNYIVFTLALVLVVTMILIYAFLRLAYKLDEVSPQQLLEYSEEIENGNYDEVNFIRLLGRDGYVEVLDGDMNHEYISDKTKTNATFSKKELFFIPNYLDSSWPEVIKITTQSGQEVTRITVYKPGEYDSQVANQFFLDKDGRVIYSLNEVGHSYFSELEISLIENTYSPTHDIFKYVFKGSDGEMHTMLLFSVKESEDDFFSKTQRVVTETIVLFIICYIGVIALFIWWLNTKVKHPLAIIGNALDSFARGERQQSIDYEGPREFVKICENFNNMSQELYESEIKAKELEQARLKTVADISHDIKTPITVIQGYAAALNDGLVPESEKPQYLKTILLKLNGLVRLIDMFSIYSKLEHPEFRLEAEPVDVCVMLQDYMTDKYNELSIGGFHLDVDIPERHIMCSIDRTQMQRALDNIINNSVKHNENGTTIYCRLEVLEKTVMITLADDGCGIPEELGNRVFDAFAMGEKSRTKQGSGLGLSITKKIVEAHGGSIELVFSGKYKTQFDIFLPRTEDAASAAQTLTNLNIK